MANYTLATTSKFEKFSNFFRALEIIMGTFIFFALVVSALVNWYGLAYVSAQDHKIQQLELVINALAHENVALHDSNAKLQDSNATLTKKVKEALIIEPTIPKAIHNKIVTPAQATITVIVDDVQSFTKSYVVTPAKDVGHFISDKFYDVKQWFNG